MIVPAAVPKDEELEAAGAVIGDVVLEKRNIFDLSNPKENKWLYRLANRLHVVTRDHVIRNQVLFEGGEPYSARLLEETERIVRSNRFIYDARIEPIRYEDGVVDVKVTTQDVWSLTPDVSFSRSGGENRTALGIEETNLLGRGQLLRLKWIDSVDRTSTQFDFEDTNLGSSWLSMFLRVADNSDGETQFLSVIRPFYALDARGSGGGWISLDDRRTALYSLGDEAAEYRHERDYITGFGGWSAGLRDGWAKRWTLGYVFDDNKFSEAVDPTLPAVIPEDRKLVYPFLGIEVLQDAFSTTSNTNQIGRTEDFYMGTRFTASLGWADDSFGADRDALIVSATFNVGLRVPGQDGTAAEREHPGPPRERREQKRGNVDQGTPLSPPVRETAVLHRSLRHRGTRPGPGQPGAARRQIGAARLSPALPDRRFEGPFFDRAALFHQLVSLAPVPRRRRGLRGRGPHLGRKPDR